MKRALVLILAAAALSACGGGNEAPEVPRGVPQAPPVTGSQPSTEIVAIAALEEAGKLPKLDRAVSLKGVDSNADGVRDDIETILKAQYPDSAQRAAVMQFARSYQAIFDVPAGDRVAAKQVKLLGTRALGCLYARFDRSTIETNPSAISEKIEAMTFNTKERMQSYMRFMDSLNGSVWSLPQGSRCDE